VSVNISDNIGGPSAGLMMSLAIFDTLTPGSMTDGADIAGTGTITPAGVVGPIGGIQQKIAAARDAGAQLFFVPADNCDGIGGVDTGDMRLAKATTMHRAVQTLSDWVADHDATLPSCEDTAS
jgi:PDZ domain-containing protein